MSVVQLPEGLFRQLRMYSILQILPAHRVRLALLMPTIQYQSTLELARGCFYGFQRWFRWARKLPFIWERILLYQHRICKFNDPRRPVVTMDIWLQPMGCLVVVFPNIPSPLVVVLLSISELKHTKLEPGCMVPNMVMEVVIYWIPTWTVWQIIWILIAMGMEFPIMWKHSPQHPIWLQLVRIRTMMDWTMHMAPTV